MIEITDEMVERALAAYRKSIVSPDHPTAADVMRSIIHAVSPMIAAQEREQCAALADKEAADAQADQETASGDDEFGYVLARGAAKASIRIAAAIRQEPGHE